jgi:hypothetical protein
VDVLVRRSLLDAAGNQLDAASPRRVTFQTRATSLHELSEDFVDASGSDQRSTSCAWDEPETPGVLVARSGSISIGVEDGGRVLGEAASIHFQLLLPGEEIPDGLASALRIEFAAAPEGSFVTSALVEAGPSSASQREPTFAANRAASLLRTVSIPDEPLAVESNEGSHPFAEIAFDEPLRLTAGRPVLLDVRLEVTPGVRVAAATDTGLVALVEGETGVAPAAALSVSPASPQARSLWYDSGAEFPGWQTAGVVRADSDPGVRDVVEYQSAPAGDDGRADAMRASAWEANLALLPAFRFVRFRVRFEGTPETGVSPRLDRIVLPYER